MAIQSNVLSSYLSATLTDKSVDDINDILDQIVLFSQALLADQNVWVFLNSPLMSLQEKSSFIEKFSKRLSVNDCVYNLFLLFVKNKRLELINQLPELCADLKSKNNGVSNIKVISCVDFDEPSKEELNKQLLSIGFTNMNITYEVDSKLISGFKIVSDNKVYDLTFKTVLNKFKSKLINQV